MKTSKENIESRATLLVIAVVFVILFTYASYLYYAVGGEKNRVMREAHRAERVK